MILGGFSIRTAPNGACLIICDELAKEKSCAHCFTTRQGGVSAGVYESLNLGIGRGDPAKDTDENYRLMAEAAGFSGPEFCFTRQVHGEHIRCVSREVLHLPADSCKALVSDALITDYAGVALVGMFADCVPILLFDPVKKVCAVVHAGWRGTALGIAAKTLNKMMCVYNCRPLDIIAAIGPAIMPCCFLVHDDVRSALLDGTSAVSPQRIEKARDDRYHIDLKGINADQLSHAGARRIYVSEHCTCCGPELFYSHRRDGASRGSMAAVIELKGAD